MWHFAIVSPNEMSSNIIDLEFLFYSSLGLSHCNVAYLEWDGTVSSAYGSCQSDIRISVEKREIFWGSFAIKRVLWLNKRRTNLTGVPWEWYDRDDVGVFRGLAWGAIIPDRRKKNRRHRVLASRHAKFHNARRCAPSEETSLQLFICCARYNYISVASTRTSSCKSKNTGVWILYVTPKTHRKQVANTSVPYLQK